MCRAGNGSHPRNGLTGDAMYKTELHCHSTEVSACARIDAETLVRRYKEAGYSTVVLTNHFSIYSYRHLGCSDWESWVDCYMDGVRCAERAAGDELTVLWATELRMDRDPNDYLVYGATEEFLRSHPDIWQMSIEQVSALARENGMLVVQAHPFRDHMQVTPLRHLDGIEVYNGSAGGHYGTDSRNDVALLWANKFGKLHTSGTDLHYPDDRILGGIASEEKITDMKALIRILKSGNYRIIREGTVDEPLS